MMKKMVVLVALISVINISHAGWESSPYLSKMLDYNHNGKLVARRFDIPHYAQPTNYTCGATTNAMQVFWETHKKGVATKYDPMLIHNAINTTGGEASGLTTNELKAGQKTIINYLRNVKKLDINMSMQEGKNSSIKDAVSTLAKSMETNYSPAILYGNVKFASAGGHYFLAVGMVYCPKGVCSSDVVGLFLNDSSYNSPAYAASHPVRKLAVSRGKYLSQNELGSYWKPTGSALPWLRGHMYLYNNSNKT